MRKAIQQRIEKEIREEIKEKIEKTHEELFPTHQSKNQKKVKVTRTSEKVKGLLKRYFEIYAEYEKISNELNHIREELKTYLIAHKTNEKAIRVNDFIAVLKLEEFYRRSTDYDKLRAIAPDVYRKVIKETLTNRLKIKRIENK